MPEQCILLLEKSDTSATIASDMKCYCGTDIYSWQRYTKKLPVACEVRVDGMCVSMKPLQPLKEDTDYILLLPQGLRVSSQELISCDKLIPIHTEKCNSIGLPPQPITAPTLLDFAQNCYLDISAFATSSAVPQERIPLSHSITATELKSDIAKKLGLEEREFSMIATQTSHAALVISVLPDLSPSPPPSLGTYTSYIRSVFPASHSTNVPASTTVTVSFRAHHHGLSVYNVHLSSFLDPYPLLATRMQYLLSPAEAKKRHYHQWYSDKSALPKILLLPICPLFNNLSPVQQLKRVHDKLMRVRYCYDANRSHYHFGDAASWQRYTHRPPVKAEIIIDEDRQIVTLRLLETLRHDAIYAIVICNGASVRGSRSKEQYRVQEDEFFLFATERREIENRAVNDVNAEDESSDSACTIS